MIGRELYTAPFIYVPSSKCEIKERNGKKVCYDDFRVDEIAYTKDRKVSRLVIRSEKGEVYSWSLKEVLEDEKGKKKAEQGALTEIDLRILSEVLMEHDIPEQWICQIYKVKTLDKLKFKQFNAIIKAPELFKSKYEESNGE